MQQHWELTTMFNKPHTRALDLTNTYITCIDAYMRLVQMEQRGRENTVPHLLHRDPKRLS